MAKTLPNHNPLHLKSWKALQQHQQELAQTTIADHFLQEPDRIEYSVLEWEDFYVDVSKNRINKRTLELLLQLANESGLEQAIQAQFNGVAINETENRYQSPITILLVQPKGIVFRFQGIRHLLPLKFDDLHS